ncbi:MAG: CDC27 family protein, partial [Candidatus Cloacimonadales bacterium]
LRLISSVEDYRELSFILSYIYPEIPEAGQKKSYQLVEQVWEDVDQINFVRSRFKLAEEDFAAAEELLQTLSDDFLSQNELFYLIAVDYLTLDKIAVAEKILASKPDLENPANFIGNYFLQEAQYQQALDYLQKNIENSDSAPEEYYLIAALAAQKLDKPQRSLQLLEAGLAHYPQSSTMLNGLGYAIADMNLAEHFDEAEQYLLQALQMEPESFMIWDSLAWLYYRQGRYQEALDILLEHCQEDLQDSAIAYHFAAVYLELGSSEAARQYLIQTLILDNDEESVQAAEDLLEEHFKINIDENQQSEAKE